MEYERLSEGLIVNVLSELELEGDEDIWMQLLKLSEDNWIALEQDVLEVLVVTEVLSIASEKVTEILSVIEIQLWLLDGEIEETVGAVNDELSLSYQDRTNEVAGNTVDEEITGWSAAYTMGSMTFKAHRNQGDGMDNTVSQESEHTEIGVTFAF